MDVTSLGLHATVYTDEGMIYLDPVESAKGEYRSYYAAEYRRHQEANGHSCEENGIAAH